MSVELVDDVLRLIDMETDVGVWDPDLGVKERDIGVKDDFLIFEIMGPVVGAGLVR